MSFVIFDMNVKIHKFCIHERKEKKVKLYFRLDSSENMRTISSFFGEILTELIKCRSLRVVDFEES